MLETQRLFIRPFQTSDIHLAKIWFQDDKVMNFIPGGADEDDEKTKRRIQKYIDHYLTHGFSKYILLDKGNHTPIGDAGIMYLEGMDGVEVGYRISRSNWGKGFATEAARCIIDHFFRTSTFDELYAIARPDNVVSIKILTQKLNFQYLKADTFFSTTMNLYGLTKNC